MNADDLIGMFSYRIEYATASDSLSERFRKIRANYKSLQSAVDAGHLDWMRGDPYEIADWLNLFTPIEMAAWVEIRGAGLSMWPQFPVGRFFVDFGNPVAKIALECDGKAFHDPKKDAERDQTLNDMGWVVIRAPGWRCSRVMDSPERMREEGEDVSEEYEVRFDKKTLAGVVRHLKDAFRLRGYET